MSDKCVLDQFNWLRKIDKQLGAENKLLKQLLGFTNFAKMFPTN